MPTDMSANSVATQLVERLDWHWRQQLRPRFDGLPDAEYFWEPVPGCWSVHPAGSGDIAFPAPEPAPFTTISWRLARFQCTGPAHQS